MIIKKIQWEEIRSIWTKYLWPNRKTPIKPTNGLICNGGWNKEIENNTPTFFGCFVDGKLVGVNSGHKAENNMYRSRGIYVFPEYRYRGIAKKLLESTIEQARLEGCDGIWSMPRTSSLKTYLSVGFEIVSDEITNMEFGPNYYVLLKFNLSKSIV